MTLHAIEGHERAREAILRAALGEGLPRVLMIHGPRGVGKQRLALWTGQLLLCDAPSGNGPCGSCRACRLSVRLEHPDLPWYFPIKRPPTRGSRDREREAMEEARIEQIRLRREEPLRPSYTEEPLGLHIGTVRNLRAEATRGPGYSERRAFVIGDAEELVAQDSSPEAANALLKVLEEPPESCWFLLTSSGPGRVPATIRSRATGLYLPPLPMKRVLHFLETHRDGTAEELEKAALLGQGSIGRSLGFLPAEDAPGPLERIRQDGFHLLRAALSSQAQERFARALAYPPAGARGLHELLTALESWLRDLAALASDPASPVLNGDARDWLQRAVDRHGTEAARVARSVRHVEAARRRASANVNPQLLLGQLLADLHRDLASSSEASHLLGAS